MLFLFFVLLAFIILLAEDRSLCDFYNPHKTPKGILIKFVYLIKSLFVNIVYLGDI